MSYAMIILVLLNGGCAKTRSPRAASSLNGFAVVVGELVERARVLAGSLRNNMEHSVEMGTRYLSKDSCGFAERSAAKVRRVYQPFSGRKVERTNTTTPYAQRARQVVEATKKKAAFSCDQPGLYIVGRSALRRAPPW